VGEDGLITIAGGKLTTYRRMSEEVVDTAVKMLRMREQLPDDAVRKSDTEDSPLPGAIDWPEDDDHERVATAVKEAANNRIGDDSALLLANTFGMRAIEVARLVATHAKLGERILPHRPEIMAQIDYSVHHEFATTVVDMIKQRTQLFYHDRDQGLDAVDKVADRMQELLGWDDETRQRMIEGYVEEVELSRAWRSEPSDASQAVDA
jgi:glycerol-3-phosphate dehydrogenase